MWEAASRWRQKEVCPERQGGVNSRALASNRKQLQIKLPSSFQVRSVWSNAQWDQWVYSSCPCSYCSRERVGTGVGYFCKYCADRPLMPFLISVHVLLWVRLRGNECLWLQQAAPQDMHFSIRYIPHHVDWVCAVMWQRRKHLTLRGDGGQKQPAVVTAMASLRGTCKRAQPEKNNRATASLGPCSSAGPTSW